MKNRVKHTLLYWSTFVMLTLPFIGISQDGEAIFKAKCNACHIMGKDGTGPNLQGVLAKWEGEEDFLYEWVLNSPKVIAEGLSQRAQAIKDYSPTVMPIQDVTLEEAIAVIAFTDAWVPPAPKVDLAEGGAGVIVYVPDYKKNLTLFYVIMGVILFLLLSILLVSKSTAALIKSDLFKQRISELHTKNTSGKGLNTILMLVFSSLSFGASALSLEVPPHAKADNLWLYVENGDLYILLIIALLLLGFLMHTVNMFFKVLRVIKPITEEQKAAKLAKQKKSSLTQVLTGAVPIEEEHKIDLGHDYDGIRELDNPMPPWWLAGFFISIVFAVVYMFHYHVLGTGDLQEVEYEKSMAAAHIEVQAYLDKMAMNVDETNATLMTDNADLMKGKELFINNCAVCHLEDGRGEVGPNLTDNYWIYGGDIKDVYRVIRKGAPNGMPEHQSKFNPIQIQQVSSYVLHLEEVSQAQGGKEPEGEFFDVATTELAEEDALDEIQEILEEEEEEEE